MQAKRGYFKSEGVRYSNLTWRNSEKPNYCGRELELAAAASSQPCSTAAPGVDSASSEAESGCTEESLLSSGAATSPEPRSTESAATQGELPPIVLVHGFAQSARSWETVAEKLAVTRDVYAIDLVGFGKSAKPNSLSAYSLQAMGGALVDFLRDLREGPLVVGYSLGGRVALSALLQAGAETFAWLAFGGLVLESAGLGMASEADRAAAATRDAATARRLREMPLADFMTYWENLPLFDSQKQLPESVRRAVRECRLANDPEALAKSVEQAGQHAMPDRADALAELEKLAQKGTPVRYVAGALDQKYTALAAMLPAGVQTTIFPNVGHNVHLEAPEAFAQFISGEVSIQP